MEDTSFPNSCADDLKNHVMKVFEEATKGFQGFTHVNYLYRFEERHLT